MKTEHTHGPWTFDRSKFGIRIKGTDSAHYNGRLRNEIGISSASYTDEVCTISGWWPESPTELDPTAPLANARLIASAPDLLAALERISRAVSLLDFSYARAQSADTQYELDIATELARAAIAKATGQPA